MIEFSLYINIKKSIKDYNSSNDVILQLKTFFGKLSSFYEIAYMFVYFILLYIAFYYLPVIYVVLFIQSVSIITDIYLIYIIKVKK